MPLYDYACERCGRFTALRPMAAYQALRLPELRRRRAARPGLRRLGSWE